MPPLNYYLNIYAYQHKAEASRIRVALPGYVRCLPTYLPTAVQDPTNQGGGRWVLFISIYISQPVRLANAKKTGIVRTRRMKEPRHFEELHGNIHSLDMRRRSVSSKGSPIQSQPAGLSGGAGFQKGLHDSATGIERLSGAQNVPFKSVLLKIQVQSACCSNAKPKIENMPALHHVLQPHLPTLRIRPPSPLSRAAYPRVVRCQIATKRHKPIR